MRSASRTPSGSPSSLRARPADGRRPAVESVERRLLMAATAVLSADGTLTVTGTAAAEAIAVTADYDYLNTVPRSVAVTVDGRAVPITGATAAPVASVVVNAGDGNDTVGYTAAGESASSTATAVAINGQGGDDTIGAGGTVRPATLHGGAGDDHVTAGGQGPASYDRRAYLYGDAGNDTLSVDEDSRVAMYGGDGDDRFENEAFNSEAFVSGGAGTDTVVADIDFGNAVSMRFAPDAVTEQTPINVPDVVQVATDVENLTITRFTRNPLTVDGNDLDNRIVVNYPGEVVHVSGYGGNDFLSVTGVAYVELDGGAGNDTLVNHTSQTAVGPAEQPHATLSGGDGTDAVDYSGGPATGVTVYLDGSATGSTGDRFDGTVEQAYGTAGPDTIYGTRGNNALFGNGGADTLVGHGGTDALFGGDGDDTAYADDGGTTYVDGGGGGADTAYVDPAGDTSVNAETVVARAGSTALPAATQRPAAVSGTAGSFGNSGNTTARAGDGNLSTYFDAPAANGAQVTLDLGTATAVTQVRFAPRSGYAARMVGGRFLASNDPAFAAGVAQVYTVLVAPVAGTLTTATVAGSAAYRYWRYVAPAGSYGNVAEVQLFGPAAAPTRLAATTFGTTGSFGNSGNTVARAADGNPSTYFDGPAANGNVVGLDLGSAKAVSRLGFAPRSGYANRMVGGSFQASNSASFGTGTVTVYTVATAPAVGSLTTVGTGTTAAYRYWRYVAPAGSYGNVAEFQLFA